MEIRIIHFYPHLMSLYGSYANVAVLRRYLEQLGNTVTVETVDYGQAASVAEADFIFMGAGTEGAAKAAMADFERFAPALKAAAEAGTAMLFAGTSMELLGKSVTTAAGETYDGIGLADFVTVQQEGRIVGDVYGHTDLYPEAVVGFMNKASVTTGVKTPLLTSVDMGIGNEGTGTPEGYREKNVFASQLTGPILVKNPPLLRAVVAAIYERRGVELPGELPENRYAENGYAITAEQLKKRSEK